MNKKWIGLLIVALIIGAMVIMMVKNNINKANPIENVASVQEDGEVGLGKGDIPPNFTLTTLDGQSVELADLKGKRVILNFWASWCGPCKAEMPHMENYYKAEKDKENVEIVAVNLTTAERNGVEGVQQFVEAYGLTFPILLDNKGSVQDTYEVITIPTTYMIGTDHKIAHKIVGPMDEKLMKELVNQLP